jgi:hypothetical protein
MNPYTAAGMRRLDNFVLACALLLVATVAGMGVVLASIP